MYADEAARLPDLSKAKYLRTKPSEDVFDSIPGNETTIKGYKLDAKLIITYNLPNGKVCGFGKKDPTEGHENFYWDKENDGIFE